METEDRRELNQGNAMWQNRNRNWTSLKTN